MRDSALYQRLSPGQVAALLATVLGLITGLSLATDRTLEALIRGLALTWLAASAWKAVLVLLSARRFTSTRTAPTADLPRYTVLAALHDEARIVGQLADRLAAIDYPADRLEGFLILEAHDTATLAAARAARLPPWLHILVAPPGAPQTKPRALNIALSVATGDLLTVYDAEDAPHPLQLREAASAFAADAGGRLACVQAPLRIGRRGKGSGPGRGTTPFLDRQFAAEYASLFEVTLPAMARLGLPFPLGGTSNHFRVPMLRAVGGWDAWNVTEDADLGFRLWRRGWRLGVISSPTWEAPPGPFRHWLPQRTRWLKGYMQTWGVHTRATTGLGWRGVLALLTTLGLGLASAAIHAPSMIWLLWTTASTQLWRGDLGETGLALGVLVLGMASAWLTCAVGARRAGAPYRITDMVSAPIYWVLLTMALANAAWRLVREPFVWDKTPHEPDEAAATVDHAVALDAAEVVGLSAAHAAAPQPVARDPHHPRLGGLRPAG